MFAKEAKGVLYAHKFRLCLSFCVWQFPDLLQDVRQYQTSVGSTQRLLSLLHQLHAQFTTQSSTSTSSSILLEQGSWSNTAQQHLNALQSRYPCYRDLLGPYEAANVYMQVGLKWMAKAVHVVHETRAFIPHAPPEKVNSFVICALKIKSYDMPQFCNFLEIWT